MECSTEDLHRGRIRRTNPMKHVVGNKDTFPGVSVPWKRSFCESCRRQFPASTVTYGKLYACYRCHVWIRKTN